MDKALNINLGKIIRTLLFWFIVMLVLISQFSWVSDIFSRVFLNFPELRTFAYEERYARFSTQRAFQSQFFVENRGHDEALDVHLYVTVLDGMITRYDAVCQCQGHYQINLADTDQRNLHVQIDNLPVNAQVRLYVWGFQPARSSSPVEFAVTARNGAARELHIPTVTESVDSYIKFASRFIGLLIQESEALQSQATEPEPEPVTVPETSLLTFVEIAIGIAMLAGFVGAAFYFLIRTASREI